MKKDEVNRFKFIKQINHRNTLKIVECFINTVAQLLDKKCDQV